MLETLDTMSYLGPATVVALAKNRVKLEVMDQHVWATMALSTCYVPHSEDNVLAIAQGGAWYVIGVISGKGKTALVVPGDLEIRAPRGRIDISAAHGVRIKSTEVAVVADRWEVAARAAFERFGDVTRWVKNAFQLRSGRVRARVEQDFELNAERILQCAERDVKIDGSKIHLG